MKTKSYWALISEQRCALSCRDALHHFTRQVLQAVSFFNKPCEEDKASCFCGVVTTPFHLRTYPPADLVCSRGGRTLKCGERRDTLALRILFTWQSSCFIVFPKQQQQQNAKCNVHFVWSSYLCTASRVRSTRCHCRAADRWGQKIMSRYHCMHLTQASHQWQIIISIISRRRIDIKTLP